jgi:hypothetical protein
VFLPIRTNFVFLFNGMPISANLMLKRIYCDILDKLQAAVFWKVSKQLNLRCSNFKWSEIIKIEREALLPRRSREMKKNKDTYPYFFISRLLRGSMSIILIIYPFEHLKFNCLENFQKTAAWSLSSTSQ